MDRDMAILEVLDLISLYKISPRDVFTYEGRATTEKIVEYFLYCGGDMCLTASHFGVKSQNIRYHINKWKKSIKE